MDRDARRHLADLAEETLALGFERVELEREAREGNAPGWWLRAGGGVAGAHVGAKFMLDAAFDAAGDVYLAEISELVRKWAKHGIPEEDRIGTVLRGPIWGQTTSDLGFFVGVFDRGTDRQREIARALLAQGIPPLLLASAFREAFEAADPADEPA